MRKSAPPLLAIFRTPLQAELLARVYLSPWDTPMSISDLARELDEPIPTVHREVSRLVKAGLFSETKVGRARVVSSPDDSLITRPLTDLLAVTFGPLPIMTDLLRGIAGIEEAYIYGSWASRYQGEPGPTPVDVDVVVVGTANVDDLDRAADMAEKRLKREVNIRRVSPSRWSKPGDDPFIRTVRERPLVRLDIATREETG